MSKVIMIAEVNGVSKGIVVIVDDDVVDVVVDVDVDDEVDGWDMNTSNDPSIYNKHTHLKKLMQPCFEYYSMVVVKQQKHKEYQKMNLPLHLEILDEFPLPKLVNNIIN